MLGVEICPPLRRHFPHISQGLPVVWTQGKISFHSNSQTPRQTTTQVCTVFGPRACCQQRRPAGGLSKEGLFSTSWLDLGKTNCRSPALAACLPGEAHDGGGQHNIPSCFLHLNFTCGREGKHPPLAWPRPSRHCTPAMQVQCIRPRQRHVFKNVHHKVWGAGATGGNGP